MEDAEEVLRTLVPVEREVRGAGGEWFLIRMRPYRSADNETDGVIFTLVDITQLKAAQAELAELNATSAQRIKELTQGLDEVKLKTAQARGLFYALFDTNPIPTVLIRQKDEVFLHANVEFLNYFQLQGNEVIGHNAAEFSLDLGMKAFAQEELRTQLQKEGKVRNIEFEIRHPSGETRIILASLQALALDQTDALITTFIDITERVRAEQQIRALAVELTEAEQAERHRLSQVLHDDLQQRLFAVQMQLSFLKDAYEKNDLQGFKVEFPQLEEWLAEAIQVTRHLSVDLSPPILHGEGLIEATIWLSSQMQEQYGLNVKIQSDGTPPPVTEKVRVLAFFAVRELLFNIVKHAGTLDAKINFEQNNGYLSVTVSDDGKGFDSQRAGKNGSSGQGLLTLRHRLNLLGCSMEVNSQPGNGTEVVIEIPYEKADD
jgi:PAS domain S-box-containing protein